MSDIEKTTTTISETTGRFLHLSKLGEGAFGAVVLAKDCKLDRLVALKSLRDRSPILVAEARALACVRHLHVCTIYDVIEEASGTYLVMEYLPLGSLRRHLTSLRDEGRKLALADFRTLTVHLCGALSAIHEAGMVHRDVKPANVLRDDFGQWKLTDFGIAVLVSDRLASQFAGTPGYTAPEILAGEPATAASDQYSLAALLFEAATGELPFPAEDLTNLLKVTRSAPRPRLLDHRPEWPLAANDILARGLAVRQSERYPSVRDLGDTLAKSLEVESVVLNEETLLVATLGKPERLVASLLRWRPGRLVFVCSPNAGSNIESLGSSILDAASARGVSISPHRIEVVTVGNAESVLQSVEDIRREVSPQVELWLSRPGRKLIVDITGGTNAMAVSLGLVARLWPCEISYVGGERSDGGVGAVVPGTERLISMANPWDALGFQAAEDATVLFNSGAYSAAADSLAQYRDHAGQEHVRHALTTFCELSRSYAHWDAARHQEALECLRRFLSSQSDLTYFEFSHAQLHELAMNASSHCTFLTALLSKDGPSEEWVADLFADALRRQARCAYDDACTRLYRSIEAIGQFVLRSRHDLHNTSSVPVRVLPATLVEKWHLPASSGENVSLALEDVFALLHLWGDPVGTVFETLELQDPTRNQLPSRYNSRLAHGFASVGRETSVRLIEKTLALARAADLDLQRLAPTFPSLRLSVQH